MSAPDEHFAHEALFYGADEDYLRQLVPFILEGLAHREPILLAVPGRQLALLRDALGGNADAVQMLDLTEPGRNPARILAIQQHFLDANAGTALRVVAEPAGPQRVPVEYRAVAQHEALINLAFSGQELTMVCPYDTTSLAAEVLADAHATHPLLRESGRRLGNVDYDIDGVLARANELLPIPPGAPTYTVSGFDALSAARRFVTDTATSHGLPTAQLQALGLIATELATNSLTHAASACHLALWRGEQHLLCAASDTGHVTDPLAGRLPPADGRLGHGLRLVHELADLVRMHTGPTGTTIYAYLRLPDVPQPRGQGSARRD